MQQSALSKQLGRDILVLSRKRNVPRCITKAVPLLRATDMLSPRAFGFMLPVNMLDGQSSSVDVCMV